MSNTAASVDQSQIGKWDPAMAQKSAVITDGVKWIDGKFLPIEGRPFDDVEHYYDRLPANVTTNVNEGVRGMKHHTSGMLFRFKTDSKKLSFKWTTYNAGLEMDHMPATGVSGIDVYRWDEKAYRWFYVSTGRIWDAKAGGTATCNWIPGTPCIINLPLYNGIRSFELGIDEDAKIEALGPRRSGIDKPVVFLGTSITHGGCCSRPGLSFVNIIGRELDVPVVNEGYSGSGRMEFEMSEHTARIDASCYVLDCLPNMTSVKENGGRAGSNVEENYEPFIRNLRTKRSDVPIIMAESNVIVNRKRSARDDYVRDLYCKLIAEGWKNLYYIPMEELRDFTEEGTVDGCHPNDLGMRHLADIYGKYIRLALALK